MDSVKIAVMAARRLAKKERKAARRKLRREVIPELERAVVVCTDMEDRSRLAGALEKAKVELVKLTPKR